LVNPEKKYKGRKKKEKEAWREEKDMKSRGRTRGPNTPFSFRALKLTPQKFGFPQIMLVP